MISTPLLLCLFFLASLLLWCALMTSIIGEGILGYILLILFFQCEHENSLCFNICLTNGIICGLCCSIWCGFLFGFFFLELWWLWGNIDAFISFRLLLFYKICLWFQFLQRTSKIVFGKWVTVPFEEKGHSVTETLLAKKSFQYIYKT